MPILTLKPEHKAIRRYYESLAGFEALNVKREMAVRFPFQTLLEETARQFTWKVVPEWPVRRAGRKPASVDAALVDTFTLPHGFWEAKDLSDDLDREIKSKFELGYPRDNILFQTPRRAVLYQDGDKPVLDENITRKEALVDVLKAFLEYRPPAKAEWERATEDFRDRVPEIARDLVGRVREERKKNQVYRAAMDDFVRLARTSLNPNLSEPAVEEMLVQHLLTERIFRKVFDIGDFRGRNVIARELEKVVTALTSRHFNRDMFSAGLERFYVAIENAAATIKDFSQKQNFLNVVYERFFQGFCVKVADTHGVVYTPQPIVDFMVGSVDALLKQELDRPEGIAAPEVHVLDPFVGTGNFIVNLMRALPKRRLADKYQKELHCNEVMLLPYYVASMNIEHAYFEVIGSYKPFEGICLVDTFQTAEKGQVEFMFVNEENTARVEEQKRAPVRVILGNPPYNAWQQNENDNNKNRTYGELDRRVRLTYGADSSASNKNALSDPYVKAFRWASDRIGQEGIVAFVTNSGFVDGIATDGMRRHLARDFDAIYVLDLGGNVRKNPKLSGTTHNVFGIQVGVCITFLVKRRPAPGTPPSTPRNATIRYAAVDGDWRRDDKYRFLKAKGDFTAVDWQIIAPNREHTWLTEGMDDSYRFLFRIFAEDSGQPAVFRRASNGLKTNRDQWVINFQERTLAANVRTTIDFYNYELHRWGSRPDASVKVDDFVRYESGQISWSRDLKGDLVRGRTLQFKDANIRNYMYRPFTRKRVYFDNILNEEVYNLASIFPNETAEGENRMIWTKVGMEVPFFVLAANQLVDLLPQGGSRCFSFYTYRTDHEGGVTERIENISDATQVLFWRACGDESISKWDIFYYIYAVLHHPTYRTRFAGNLRRELPRVPFAPDFATFAKAGKMLADLHINYEQQVEFPLRVVEDRHRPLDWRVERMKFSTDRSAIHYNDFFTLEGVPPAVFDYKLGSRSALEWVLDQYQVSTDTRSGLVTDPNRTDDEGYLMRLIGQVITVSLETQKIIAALPPDLGLDRSVAVS